MTSQSVCDKITSAQKVLTILSETRKNKIPRIKLVKNNSIKAKRGRPSNTSAENKIAETDSSISPKKKPKKKITKDLSYLDV